jgi:hypothetical protein
MNRFMGYAIFGTIYDSHYVYITLYEWHIGMRETMRKIQYNQLYVEKLIAMCDVRLDTKLLW